MSDFGEEAKKKLKYERPGLIPLTPEFAQAATCSRGSLANQQCYDGNNAGGFCNAGTGPGRACKSGTSAGKCSMGTDPAAL